MKNRFHFFAFFFLILTSFFFFVACENQKGIVEAEIDGLGNDTIYVKYQPVSEYKLGGVSQMDTIVAKNNRFTYKIEGKEDYIILFEPQRLVKTRVNGKRFQLDTRSIFIVLPCTDHIAIKGKIENGYIDYTAEGSWFNKDYSMQRSNNRALLQTADSLDITIDSLCFSPHAPYDSDSLINNLIQHRIRIIEQLKAEKQKFIEKNPFANLSAFYINQLPIDSFETYYYNLSEAVRRSLFKGQLDKKMQICKENKLRYENKQKIVLGGIAPDFVLKDIKGNDFRLTSLKSDYILLDFWGSWCSQSVKDYPKIKRYYNQHKDKIEIVSIACYDNHAAWRKAVNNNKMGWIQVINDESGEIEQNVSVMYSVDNYPTRIILDKDMTIKAIIVGNSDDLYKDLDSLTD